jgi:DNA helicase-2/ATP-dependent DNA helicase PcrA
MRYVHAFPAVARPPEGMPQTGEEWAQIYRGAILALRVKAIREVVAASYDRIVIDEYQDCHSLQHKLAVELSRITPTFIFGDPMQGIFEFAGATLNWDNDIHQDFPLAGTLETPHRWAGKNPELGLWIAETRLKLMRGEPIDLSDPRIDYRKSDDTFDMGTLFDDIDGKDGSFAAIHCNKTICYRLAKAANGGYQAIEEIAANRLQLFANSWDQAGNAKEMLNSFTSLIDDCFHKKPVVKGEPPDDEDVVIQQAMRALIPELSEGNGADAVTKMFSLARKRPRWRLYRSELWRDAERVAIEVAAGRSGTMMQATLSVRQRASVTGRRLPKRTVSTPLLLKGLEFDHVVIPNAIHFTRERLAQAKLFYVAISRATQSLTISSPERFVQFPVPDL